MSVWIPGLTAWSLVTCIRALLVRSGSRGLEGMGSLFSSVHSLLRAGGRRGEASLHGENLDELHELETGFAAGLDPCACSR